MVMKVDGMNISLHMKLVVRFCIILILLGIAAALISVHLINVWSLRQTRERLEGNLSSAREVFNDRIAEMQTILAFTALRTKTVKGALIAGDTHTLFIALQEVRNVSGMDVLTVTDATGRVIIRAHRPDLSGDSLLDDKIVARVLKTGNPVKGIVLVPRSKLAAESTSLAERIALPTVSARGQSPQGETGMDAGMMIEAAVPIAGDDKRMIGILIGGKLLNGDRSIVDRVKNIVFVNDEQRTKEIGMVAVYQGTLCIAASTLTRRGPPGVGAMVPQNILGNSPTPAYSIIKRATEAGKGSIVMYDAIRAIDGKVIGLFSVGLYEIEFLNLRKRQAIIIIIGIIVFCVFCAVAAWFMLSKSIVRPIKDLVSRAQQMIDTKAKPSYLPNDHDEVSAMGNVLNYFMSSVEEQDTQIKTIRNEMNQARRLSTLGKLAAGVAHEINNPLGGILVYSNLLLEDMPPEDPRYANVEKIIRESNRCKNIIKGLLDFARQSHPLLNPADVNLIVAEALDNLLREPVFKHIRLERMLDASLPMVMVDSSQIQEVFENIIRNAAEAMEGSGMLTIRSCTRVTEEGREIVEVQFADSGPGIPLEYIEHIFDPFFTTKKCGHGTGLGLAVSYGIIERHGGAVAVRNGDECGAIFTVRLPL
jgi:two-component system NtrC family sensor kinase